ncbi:hypothetical protein SO802_020914 [Lithocarpus litseifolius]|uniref:Uncharacterized protein n=1 Tax=Lithocarpus litseifolius TaxID=425828 RepID=A0AAW2CFE0_9ROSI
MLLMEMAGKRKNLNAIADHSSQLYFRTWVYDQIIDRKDIEMEDNMEEEKKTIEKMIIVALWCIQMNPRNRPPMNKVVEMFEQEIEFLQMPPKPFLSSLERPIGDGGGNLSPTCSSFQSELNRIWSSSNPTTRTKESNEKDYKSKTPSPPNAISPSHVSSSFRISKSKAGFKYNVQSHSSLLHTLIHYRFISASKKIPSSMISSCC